VYAILLSSITLSQDALANSNTAEDRGGGLYVQTSTLTASSSSIEGNAAGVRVGGVYAILSSCITLSQGALVNSNVVADWAGGLYVQASTLTALNSFIDGNKANYGGGVCTLSSSSIMLSQGALANSNTAFFGGGLYVQESTLTASSSSIDGNTAREEGCGVYVRMSSSITLANNASVEYNVAKYCGGGISLEISSTLTFANHTRICSNTTTEGPGGGIAASGESTIQLGPGVLTLCNNIASTDGGACALLEASALIDDDLSDASGQPSGSRTQLAVHGNTASNGDGDGLAVLVDSSIKLGVKVVALAGNIAGQRGGGLFFDATQQDEAGYSPIQIAFWHLDLVDNVAQNGDRGGLCSYSRISLLLGGRTNATGNKAARGGAMALSDAAVLVQPGHMLIAQHNSAQLDSGAVVLLAGASLLLLETTKCLTSCPSANRSGGSCEPACLSLECNWDCGDCGKQRMDWAGEDARQTCDQDTCSFFKHTYASTISEGCAPVCFTAACDWSRELCADPRDNVQVSPLIDVATFASIQMTQK